MEKRQFRLKKQLFTIGGIYNIPGFVICSGHGYAFRTFCCKECGELFVVDLEGLYHSTLSLPSLVNDKLCPNCNASLRDSLVNYPENIYYKGALLKNTGIIDRSNFEETEILEVYLLN